MTDLKSKIIESSSGKLDHVAKVVHHVLNPYYKYKNGRWKHLVNGEWLDDGDGITLRQDISNAVVKSYIDFIIKNNDEAFDQTEAVKDKYLTVSMEVTKIRYYLEIPEYKDKLLCNCASLWSKMKSD